MEKGKTLRESILELMHTYKAQVDNFNEAVFEDDFESLTDDIMRLI